MNRPTPDCASGRKINPTANDDLHSNANDCDYNIIINYDILQSFFGDVLTCPICADSVTFTHNIEQRMGFSYNIILQCKSCNWNRSTYTSKRVDNTTGFFQINSQ